MPSAFNFLSLLFSLGSGFCPHEKNQTYGSAGWNRPKYRLAL
jgi:hypothetical protein